MKAFDWIKAIPNRLPLRVQLVIVLLALVTLALSLAGAAGTAALRGYLVDRVDDRLHETAGSIMQQGGRLLAVDPGARIDRRFDMLDGPALTDSFYAQIVDPFGEGNGVLRVPSGSSQTAPDLPVIDFAQARERDGKPFTVASEGAGNDWRVLVSTLPGRQGALVIGTSLTDVSNTVHRLIAIQLIISVVVLAGLGAAGYFIVKTSLRKLVRVEQTAAAIAAGDLSRRVDVGDDETEVGRVGKALDTMLATIEKAFAAQRASEAEARASEDRMRRFVGDASHELRTPLTSIRGFAELQRQATDLDIAERNRLTSRIEAEAKRMSLLVEDLLLLARLDQQRPLEREAVDVVELVEDVVADGPVLGAEHELSVEELPFDSNVWVLGDTARLRQVMANLVNNAFVHTPAGTRVRVSVQARDDDVAIVVSDNGPGMDEETAAQVFDRFYRSDPSRTRASGGSGLGLSIASAIVAAHGGSIAVEASPGNGAAFTVTLPRIRENDSVQAVETDSETASESVLRNDEVPFKHPPE